MSTTFTLDDGSRWELLSRLDEKGNPRVERWVRKNGNANRVLYGFYTVLRRLRNEDDFAKVARALDGDFPHDAGAPR